ncbi:hypothetical protein SISSUDRAFT_1041151 [Sistotremastrum suecicum HHB10207 ss-3]|uniref:Uncharacterized protein n=1 Tax=Sistotremastrum suecicum HHB10207 ss-3 TaxID=1314776 RepID=A0A166HME3_9AGAM|nr:hypothetical protein SISSUDRAFT_1041151 [Sistotremastrum suecicum HHB10207 ss-3]
MGGMISIAVLFSVIGFIFKYRSWRPRTRVPTSRSMPVDIAPTPSPEALVHVVLPNPIAFPPMAHLPPRLAGLENDRLDRGNAQEMLRLIAANATLESDDKVKCQEMQHMAASLQEKDAYITILERQLQEKTQENASLQYYG